MHTVQDFIERMARLQDIDALRDEFAAAIGRMGLDAYTYGGVRLPRTGRATPVILSTYPTDWASHYVEMGYQGIDPVNLAGLSCALLPYRWSSLRPASPEQARLLAEGASVGLVSGLSVPVHGPAGEFALISMSSNLDASEFDRLMVDHQHALHLMATYFHAAIVDRTAAAADAPKAVHLTRRETEVLQWIAKGKTANEVADITGLTERTVVYHIENAKTKLGASARSYAVAKALRLGLILP